MKLRSITTADVRGKRVLVRCGFDVPFDDNGEITDDDRIQECLPTIKHLIEQGAKVILCGHNGRPKGQVVLKLSMAKVAERLTKLLKQEVKYLNDCIGPEVTAAVTALQPGQVLLLENLRFHGAEETNGPAFAKQLADLGELYVNEAFSNIHRDHASMTGIPKLLPSYAGFRLQKEVETLANVMKHPAHPFVAVIGGAKISDKIQVIKQLLKVADHVLLGGALANNILKAQGLSVGKSLVEEKMMHVAKELTLVDTHLHVPVDVITARKIAADVLTEQKAVGSVADDEYILDIGPDTIKLFEMIIKEAKTIVWGGPMGYFELKPFAQGTFEVAKLIGQSEATSVAGGGDTVEALEQSGFKKKISFISTGGGAMLKFLEGAPLPALALLMETES